VEPTFIFPHQKVKLPQRTEAIQCSFEQELP